MAENLNLNVNVDTSGATNSVGSLKKQLREAQAEVMSLADKFGATSKEAITAAKRAAELKDAIGDAKALTEAFNPDAKFKALTASLSGVAGGFGAIQGAMALFGAESDNVQKTLLKVQSAMAISQGLQAVGESIDSFKQLGAVIQNSTTFQKANSAATSAAAAVQKLFTGSVDMTTTGFKNLKFAMAATGIGLLVVAIGTLIANFDKLSSAMSNTTDVELEHTKAQESASKAIADYTMKLYSVENALDAAKKGTMSKKDALKEYNDKLGDTIGYAGSIAQAEKLMAANTTVVIKSIKLRAEAQVMYAKAAEYSGKIVSGETTEIGFWEGFYNHISSLGNWGKTAVANAEDMGKKVEVAQKAIKGLQAEGDKLSKEAIENDKLLQKGLSTKPGTGKSTGKSSEQIQAEKDRKLQEAKLILHDANKKLKTQQEQEIQSIDDAYAEKRKKLAEAKVEDNGDLAKAEQAERKAVDEKYKKLELDKENAFQAELNKIKLDVKLAGIKDEYEKSKFQLEENYKKQYEDIDKNENYNEEKRIALKVELKKKENAELDALQLTRDSKKAETDIAELDKEITKAASDLEFQKTLLDQKDILLEQSFKRRLITEDAYKAGVEANSKARIEIDKQETEAKMRNAEMLSQVLNTVSDIIGRNTATGKVMAVAATTIDTYIGAQKAYNSQLIPGDPSSPVRAAIAAAIAVAGGIKNVKSILAVKTPGGGGGGASAPSMPSMSSSAPMTPPMPQAQTTNISQQSINQMGNQAVRAYVIENDVTSNQQRVEAIKQRARFS